MHGPLLHPDTRLDPVPRTHVHSKRLASAAAKSRGEEKTQITASIPVRCTANGPCRGAAWAGRERRAFVSAARGVRWGVATRIFGDAWVGWGAWVARVRAQVITLSVGRGKPHRAIGSSTWATAKLARFPLPRLQGRQPPGNNNNTARRGNMLLCILLLAHVGFIVHKAPLYAGGARRSRSSAREFPFPSTREINSHISLHNPRKRPERNRRCRYCLLLQGETPKRFQYKLSQMKLPAAPARAPYSGNVTWPGSSFFFPFCAFSICILCSARVESCAFSCSQLLLRTVRPAWRTAMMTRSKRLTDAPLPHGGKRKRPQNNAPLPATHTARRAARARARRWDTVPSRAPTRHYNSPERPLRPSRRFL